MSDRRPSALLSRAAQSREFSRLPQMKSLLAGYVRLRSHSRSSLLGECGAKLGFFPVHIFFKPPGPYNLNAPSIPSSAGSLRTRRPMHYSWNHHISLKTFIQYITFTIIQILWIRRLYIISFLFSLAYF